MRAISMCLLAARNLSICKLGLLLFCMASSEAQAQWEFSGNELFSACRPAAANGTNEYYWDSMKCYSYVFGVIDGMIDMTRGTGGIVRAPCFPNGASRGQVVDIVSRYLASHPESRHLNAGALVSAALYQAFPCNP